MDDQLFPLHYNLEAIQGRGEVQLHCALHHHTTRRDRDKKAALFGLIGDITVQVAAGSLERPETQIRSSHEDAHLVTHPKTLVELGGIER